MRNYCDQVSIFTRLCRFKMIMLAQQMNVLALEICATNIKKNTKMQSAINYIERACRMVILFVMMNVSIVSIE